MNLFTGNKLGLELLEALGVDAKQVYSVSIICNTGEPARVEIGRYVELVDDVSVLSDHAHRKALGLTPELLQYELVFAGASTQGELIALLSDAVNFGNVAQHGKEPTPWLVRARAVLAKVSA